MILHIQFAISIELDKMKLMILNKIFRVYFVPTYLTKMALIQNQKATTLQNLTTL